MPRCCIGTSGWMYDHWRGRFYPPHLPKHRWFVHYLTIFHSVELNGTFYGTPTPATVQRWYDLTPEDFVFAVKGTRYVTHNRKLRDFVEALVRQDAALAPLGAKQGPILWQFSPKWRVDPDRLDRFLSARPPGQQWCFEFRHSDAFSAETISLLARHHCAVVWADTPNFPFSNAVTADFLYARLHGHEQLYVSKYSGDQLRWWRDQLLDHAEGHRAIFAYFDNDAHGHAPHDAWRLQQLLLGEQKVPDEIPAEHLYGSVSGAEPALKMLHELPADPAEPAQ